MSGAPLGGRTDRDDTGILAGLRARDDDKLVREIVTPEGVPLRFQLAPTGDRAAAFVLDVVLQTLLIVGIALLLQLAAGGAESSWLTPVVIVLAFVITNFYFAFFEVRWQGATPGKRQVGIRVIDARGGQLETSAILARNLVRELEVWMPLRFIFAHQLMWPGAPGWAIVVAATWSLIFLFLPLLNKDKLRVGDLIAGTRVVRQPKLVLAPELVTDAPSAPIAIAGFAHMPGPALQAGYAFTDAQLAVYGIYELQVLEGVLRTDAGTPAHYEAVRSVSERIRWKIKFVAVPPIDDERFLREFYAALRAHLEQKMLFGHRRADKFSK
jgi:uncharacterized RDD family membrane protein YckC